MIGYDGGGCRRLRTCFYIRALDGSVAFCNYAKMTGQCRTVGENEGKLRIVNGK